MPDRQFSSAPKGVQNGSGKPTVSAFDADLTRTRLLGSLDQLYQALDVLRILDDTASNWTAVNRMFTQHKTLLTTVSSQLQAIVADAQDRAVEASRAQRDRMDTLAELDRARQSHLHELDRERHEHHETSAQLRETRAMLQAAESRTHTLETDLEATRDRLARVESTCDMLKGAQALATAEQDKSRVQSQRIEWLESELTRREAASGATIDHERTSYAELQAQFREASQDLSRLTLEVGQLRSERESLRSLNEVSATEVDGLLKELESMRGGMDDLLASKERIAEQLRVTDRREQATKSLLREQEQVNESLVEQLDLLKNQEVRARVDHRDSVVQVRGQRDKIEDLEREVKEREAHVGQLIGEISVVRIKLAKLESARDVDRERAQMQYETLEKEKKQVERALDIEKAKVMSLKKDMNQLTQDLSNETAARRVLAEDLANLRAAVAVKAMGQVPPPYRPPPPPVSMDHEQQTSRRSSRSGTSSLPLNDQEVIGQPRSGVNSSRVSSRASSRASAEARPIGDALPPLLTVPNPLTKQQDLAAVRQKLAALDAARPQVYRSH